MEDPTNLPPEPHSAEFVANAVGATQSLRYDADTRTIYLWADIDCEVAGQFVATMMVVDRTPGPIRVILSSHGGESTAGFAIYDVIRSARNAVTIDAYGACQSIAAVILQAGNVRRLSKHCEFMIHNSAMEIGEGSHSVQDLAIMRSRVDVDNKVLHRILAERAGIPVAKVKELCQRDFHLTAIKAVKMGFADEVIQ